MSIYVEFISDVANRCAKLLSEEEWDRAQSCDREVTLLLSVAAFGLNAPLERIKDQYKLHGSATPSGVVNAWNSIQNTSISSCMWKPKPGHKRSFGGLDLPEEENVRTAVDRWRHEEMNEGLSVCQVLSHVRNAVAHGNILMNGHPRIDSLLFISGKITNRVPDPNGWKVLSCTPEDFRCLLQGWFKWLAGISIPKELMPSAA